MQIPCMHLSSTLHDCIQLLDDDKTGYRVPAPGQKFCCKVQRAYGFHHVNTQRCVSVHIQVHNEVHAVADDPGIPETLDHSGYLFKPILICFHNPCAIPCYVSNRVGATLTRSASIALRGGWGPLALLHVIDQHAVLQEGAEALDGAASQAGLGLMALVSRLGEAGQRSSSRGAVQPAATLAVHVWSRPLA